MIKGESGTRQSGKRGGLLLWKTINCIKEMGFCQGSNEKLLKGIKQEGDEITFSFQITQAAGRLKRSRPGHQTILNSPCSTAHRRDEQRCGAGTQTSEHTPEQIHRKRHERLWGVRIWNQGRLGNFYFRQLDNGRYPLQVVQICLEEGGRVTGGRKQSSFGCGMF